MATRKQMAAAQLGPKVVGTGSKDEEGQPKLPLVDIHPENDPVAHRQAVANIASVFRATPEHVRVKAARWYDNVHEATAKGIKGSGMDIHQGAGIVAAVSPNMDWDNNNIHALHEIRSLRGRDWASLTKGEANVRELRHQAHQAFGAGDFEGHERLMSAAKHETERSREPLAGMSISRSPLSGLLKAHRIMEGEDVESVLPRRTAPKTNSFMHNIAEPQTAGHVTIDGRAHDIAANRMQGWTQGRGIGSAALKRGTSRYEHFEQAYRTAATAIGMEHGVELHPHQVQAVTWEGGKAIEKSAPTKSGAPRKVGVRRVGQPYVS